ncbi:MAG: glucans biosynthesis glucosyltransferase MdoH [Pseudomonadales bacterium]|nr:glucans biosynthesis glucosyltransferase MdoH [Pseudomonadales bacterium]
MDRSTAAAAKGRARADTEADADAEATAEAIAAALAEAAGAPHRALPPEAPLAMPRQPVSAPALPLSTRRGALRQRLALFGYRFALLAGTALLTVYGVREMYAVLAAGGLTGLQAVFLALFTLNFLWIAQAGCAALLGVVRTLAEAFGVPPPEAEAPLRTAVLVPVYNEDPRRVAAAIRVMAVGLAERAPGAFAFFVLSDTNRPAAWIEEERVFRSLVAGADARAPVYYRHRADNAERKAGNVSDWVMRWGGAWPAFLILDADSLMAPETMVRLSRRLRADPGLGLIQTVPTIIRGRSLYARLQQFANRCFGSVSAAGLAAWQGVSANYWGHNAILRTRAFAEAARLPILSGAPPFGGGVLSHDFIEAAFLRRAGWGVRIDADLDGSYEEAPPSLADVLIRDRRWCQGNLQHSRFLFAGGLTLPSRLHLLSGIMAYASAALWFALVVVGLLLGLQAAVTRPEYFAQPSLFPSWPVFDAERAITLFLASMGLVLAPKLLAWLVALCSWPRLRAFGGPLRLTIGVVTEILLSALYAPIMMYAQTRLLLQVLTGADAGWQPQRRDGAGVSLAAAWRMHRADVAMGMAMAAVAWLLHVDLFLWLLPVTLGLVLAPLLSWVSEREAPARLLGALGALRTPGTAEERALVGALEAARAEQRAGETIEGPLRALAEDPPLRAFHLAQLPLHGEHERFDRDLALARAKAEWEPDLAMLEGFLEPRELMACLGDAETLEQLVAAAQAHEADVSSPNPLRA